jgi:hypothetical protein
MRIIRRARGFPNRTTVAYLSRLGIRSVVLHTDRIAGTPWRRAVERPVAGLPLARSRSGELVIYELR